jgi:hypothetical protein
MGKVTRDAEGGQPKWGQDRMRWCLEKSGKYTTKSMYGALSHRGVVNIRMRKIWGSKLPMKLKIFMWQAC